MLPMIKKDSSAEDYENLNRSLDMNTMLYMFLKITTGNNLSVP